MVTLDKIDADKTVFPNYFGKRDKAKVKAVFQAIAGPCNTGKVLLSKITIQTDDWRSECDPETLAYMYPPAGKEPHITLCPPFFKKKSFGKLKGAPDPENDPANYRRCDEIQANGHVSYLMKTMGATLLHEFTNYDQLLLSIYKKPIVDKVILVNKRKGIDDPLAAYGAWAVYNVLNKNRARLNADSYLYNALELFWGEYCQTTFLAPRVDIDNVDPDCGSVPCSRDTSLLSSLSSDSDSGSDTHEHRGKDSERARRRIPDEKESSVLMNTMLRALTRATAILLVLGC